MDLLNRYTVLISRAFSFLLFRRLKLHYIGIVNISHDINANHQDEEDMKTTLLRGQEFLPTYYLDL